MAGRRADPEGGPAASFRIEHDPLGPVRVPADRRYGPQTARAIANFPVSGRSIGENRHLVRALSEVKIAAARANAAAGLLPPERCDAIVAAAAEAAAGRFDADFAVDVFQGGAGTSSNMNANEVIARRASELLGSAVHPIDDVNRSQSTNDAYATAARLSVLYAHDDLARALRRLADLFGERAAAFASIRKLGRTQLQDAVPMTLGAELGAHAAALRDCGDVLAAAAERLLSVNLGGTAVGTGIGAHPAYRAHVVESLREVCGLPLRPCGDLLQASWDLGDFVTYAGALDRAAVTLSKIASDIRLLSSGPRGGLGELKLPALQPGSSLMPAKINPVAAELLNQVCFFVRGQNVAIGMAAEAGQLQLNAMEPFVVQAVHESLRLLTRTVDTFGASCVAGLAADAERCRRNLEDSTALAALLVPMIGYERASAMALAALHSGERLIDAVRAADPELAERLAREATAGLPAPEETGGATPG